jgi:hypothetical protein
VRLMTAPVCEICGKPFDPKDAVLREVQGWLRPQGTGGGQIVKRRMTGKFAHRGCVDFGPPEGSLFR